MADKVVIGNATLYCADCMEVLPTLPKVDAVITDPPYGIGADKGKSGGATSFNGSKPVDKAFHPENTWDDVRPDDALIRQVSALSKICIMWGGNYFADLLTPQGRWLWWDKCQTMPSFGDGELAWTNLPQKTPKKFVWANNKIFADRVERHHPTQKPLELMEWCVAMTRDDAVICDPFMGGGTTGVACMNLGRIFIGIEREPKYFDIACKRIEQAVAQGQLFEPEPVKQVQEGLL